VTTSPAHSGSGALAGAASASNDAQCTQTVSVQPSSAYTLTGWVQGSYVFLGDTGTGSSDTDTWTASAAGWQQLSTSFSTGASTTSVTVYVHGWYGEGSFYADDLSLTGPAGSGGGGGSGSTAPAAPSGLAVTGITASSVSLSWTAPAVTVTGYNVDENGTEAASVAGASATVSGLAAATAYSFTVTAYNAAGESAASAAVQATTASSGNGGAAPAVTWSPRTPT
jgi:Fibronectin type III domain